MVLVVVGLIPDRTRELGAGLTGRGSHVCSRCMRILSSLWRLFSASSAGIALSIVVFVLPVT